MAHCTQKLILSDLHLSLIVEEVIDIIISPVKSAGVLARVGVLPLSEHSQSHFIEFLVHIHAERLKAAAEPIHIN